MPTNKKVSFNNITERYSYTGTGNVFVSIGSLRKPGKMKDKDKWSCIPPLLVRYYFK